MNDSIESKIETIAKKIYGADGIDISPEAQVAIDRYKKQGTLIQNQYPIRKVSYFKAAT